LREGGRAAEIGKEDRDGLALAFEAERVALDHALDDGRGKEALQSAAPVELEDERAHRKDDRGEHEAVVLPPRRRPYRSQKLRDLRLREEHVRDGERALKRQPRSNEIAALRDGGVAIQHDDRVDDQEGHPPRAPGDVAVRRRSVAVARWLVTRGGPAR